MATQSPDSFLDGLFGKITAVLQPPRWVVDELQRRLVLTLNHVLYQEPEAQARLKRQCGRLVEAHWRAFSVRLQATPAGLLELGSATAQPDLTLTLTEDSPFALARSAVRGDKPSVRISGDVQLAAEVQWLVDHVRWDIEEDVSRVIGDAPAHALGQAFRRMGEAMRSFVGSRTAEEAATPTASPGPTVQPTPAAAAASGAVPPGVQATTGVPPAPTVAPAPTVPPSTIPPATVPPAGVPPDPGAAPAGPPQVPPPASPTGGGSW